MKKIFTLLTMTLLAIGAQAQTTYDLSGLSTSGFTFNAEDFAAAAAGSDSDGNPYNGAFDYKKKDKNAWSDLAVSGTSIVFQYKNKDEKAGIYKLYDNYVLINGKDSRIVVNDLTEGQIVTLKVASKGGTASKFNVIEGGTADSENPADAGTKETDPANFKEFKFTATASTLTIQETAGGFNIASVTISAGSGSDDPVTPAEPHAATIWDFTTISDADLTALSEDATNWSYDSASNRYGIKGTWAAKVSGAYGADVTLIAGSTELAYAAGLKFARYANDLKDDNIRIDVGKRLGVNAKQLRVTISDLAKDDVIKIRFSSTKEETRGFNVTNADKTTIEASTVDPVEETLTVASDGDVTLVTTNGVYVYALTINAALPEVTGISTINAETATDAVIYNLSGQRVDESYRGVVIKNGKKVVIK